MEADDWTGEIVLSLGLFQSTSNLTWPLALDFWLKTHFCDDLQTAQHWQMEADQHAEQSKKNLFAIGLKVIVGNLLL